MSLLKNIQSPEDLKKIDQADLPDLATEVRDLIIDVVSKNGGHLASSLGTVELSIALHYVFNTPSDKIVWDVGHQAYTHKILTGRKDRFHTLRQGGGISGFTKIGESPFDAFSVGHSSTSISAGAGMACANCIKGGDKKVISVIGDGSMTAGLAFEGLNQVGSSKKDQIVILNDNDMSISQNVGALSSFLSRKLSARRMQGIREEFKDILKSLPGIGDDVYEIAKRSESSFRAFVTPGMLFQAFGFEYYGPIDGHNMDHLIDILENIKSRNKPVLLHVATVKGKGYGPAEKNPVYFHGVGSFNKITGDTLKKSDSSQTKIPTYTEVFGNSLLKLAEKDPKVVAITAAMPEGTGLKAFAKKFPKRFYDVGIAEQHGVTFAAGMALEGLKPVVAIYSTFLQRAYDQIIHDVCLENIPVVFALDRAGIVGEDGPTHHGLFDLSFLRSMPNITIMAPKDENELKNMLFTAVNHDGPVAIRYPRGKATGEPMGELFESIPMGEAEVLTSGEDLLILAAGTEVAESVAAAEKLKDEGINATVVNMRFIKPMDTELLKRLATKIPNIITVEENVRQGGFGSAVLETLNDLEIYDTRVKRVGIPDKFIEHGSQDDLRNKYGLKAESLVATARQMLQVVLN